MYAHKLRNSPRNAIGVERVNQRGGCKPKGTLNPYNGGDKDVGPPATVKIPSKKAYENKWEKIAGERSRTHAARTNAQSCVRRVNIFALTYAAFIVYAT